MKGIAATLATSLVFAASASAEDDVTAAPQPALGVQAVPLQLPADWENPLARADLSVEQYRSLPYAVEVYHGADQLGLHPQYIHDVREGLSLLFHRQYKEVRTHFEEVDARFPGTGIGAVMDVVVWQALMLENFDYRFDRQYQVSSERARSELEAALEAPGGEGWEHFLLAGVSGIEAIHTMRQERYLPALQLAFEAMAHAGKAREHAPAFVDLLLADGMYNYWRTVVTQSSRMLPDFGDHKAEGLAQMQEVETRGVFLAAPATLSLAFSYVEDRELKHALTACARNGRTYPESIINNLVLGQVQVAMRRYDAAMETWGRIEAEDPSNDRVRYWKAVTLLRRGDADAAEVELAAYLGSPHVVDYHRAAALYRLGQVYYRQERYAEAADQYKAAVKLGSHQSAKAALDRMKRSRREGRIDY